MNNNIVNIINFIRAVEPRFGRDEIDLFEPMREQMALAKKHHLPTTWLLQYDALVEGPFVDFLKQEMPDTHEIGIWFEVVQQNVEAAGIPWRGRWSWDWHTDVGFSVGYSPREREKIADCFIAKFEETFGFRPKSMGSWLFDAHLLGYLHDRYGIECACNCKDQYGTDGYTLWGGYWANGYYPARNNAYLPAQSEANRIPVPVFRMLGSDPLYQYDAVDRGNGQIVVTLEPVYAGAEGGGGDPAWCEWFFRENVREPHFAMSYAQAGQENSFGWPKMGAGLRYQYAMLERLRDEGVLRIETLHETGAWFRENFSATPVTAVVTREDWRNENHQGVWYLSQKGRINLFRTETRELLLRDWQLFSDDYPEPFLRDVCTTSSCTFDALPLVDGMLWHPASIAFPGGPGELGSIRALPDRETMEIEWLCAEGTIAVTLTPEGITVEFPRPGMALHFRYDAGSAARHHTTIECDPAANSLLFRHNSARYCLNAVTGQIIPADTAGWDLAASGTTLRLTGTLG